MRLAQGPTGLFEKLAGFLVGGGAIHAYLAVFFLLFFAGWAVPLPEEATVIAAGYVTKKNGLHLPIMIACAYAGVLCGDLVIFQIGRRHGDWIFRLRLFRWLMPEDRLARARRLFAEHGSKVAFFGRFVTGIRLVVFFTAGNLGVPVGTFIFYDSLAILLTIPIGLIGGYHFADEIEEAFTLVGRSNKVLGLLVVGAATIWLVHRWATRRAAAAAEAAAVAAARSKSSARIDVAEGARHA